MEYGGGYAEQQRSFHDLLIVLALAIGLVFTVLLFEFGGFAAPIAVIASAILSWLIAFNVVNTRNQFVAGIAEFLYRITEPALRPIRQRLPNLGGLDISPIVLILLIMLIQRIIIKYIYPNVF